MAPVHPHIVRLRVTTHGNTVSAASQRADKLRTWLRRVELPGDRPVLIEVEREGTIHTLGPLRVQGRRYYRWGTGNFRSFEETLSDLCELASRRPAQPHTYEKKEPDVENTDGQRPTD